MLQHERHERILSFLVDHDFISVEKAVELVRSSPATIRRDFNALAESRLARRTRGGLCRLKNAAREMVPFAFGEVQNAKEKAALARRAAGLAEPGDVLFVDGGTTTFQMAQYLKKMPVRCITTSIYLARELGEGPGGPGTAEAFLTGGYLYPQSGLLIGPMAKASLAQYHANCAFISVAAISSDGIFNSNELVVESERTMIENADRTIVLADHTKVGKRSMCRICGLDRIDALITAICPENRKAVEEIRETGLEVIGVDIS